MSTKRNFLYLSEAKGKNVNMKKIQNIFSNGILVLLAIFVFYSMYHALFILPYGKLLQGNNADFTAMCIAGSIILIAFIWMFYRFILRLNEKQVKCLKFIILAVILVLQIVWLFVVMKNHVFPATDLATNTEEAFGLLERGSYDENSSAAIYPFNRTHTIILFAYYKVLSGIGLECFWEASLVLALICMDISVLFSCKIARIITGIRGECIFALFCFLNPVVYLCLPYYYTSVTSLPFMMASAYFIIKLIKEENCRKGILYGILVGALSAFGYLIRGTALFPLIALVVYGICVIRKGTDIKRVLLRLGVIFVFFCLVFVLWKGITKHYDLYDRSESRLTIMHTLMMSLQGDGGYVQSDVDYSLSFEKKEEREAANLRVIKKRLSEMGVAGYLNLTGEKVKHNWAEGNERYTNWYPLTFRYISGERRDFLMMYSQVLRVVVWLFMGINICICLKRKTKGFGFLGLITMFGAFVLHAFIETNPQYSVPFLLIMSLTAVEGIVGLGKYISDGTACFEQGKGRRLMSLLTIISTAVIVIAMVEQYPVFVKYDRDRTDIVSGQGYGTSTISDVAASDLTVKQSFAADKRFNTLQLRAVINDYEIKDKLYEVSLYEENGNVLWHERFGAEAMDASGNYVTFSFPDIVPEKKKTYEIILKSSEQNESRGDSLMFKMENKHLDYDPAGKLWINDKEEMNGDLTYLVSRMYREPIWGIKSYSIICFVIGLVCIAITVCFIKRSKI